MSTVISADYLVDENLTSCLYVLENDPNIARGFLYTKNFIDEMTFLIAREMDTIKHDISYWQNMSKMEPFFSTTYKYYISFYRQIYNFNLFHTINYLFQNVKAVSSQSMKQLGFSSSSSSSSSSLVSLSSSTIDIENIDQNIIILRSHFLILAQTMARIHDASVMLKYAMKQIEEENPMVVQDGRIIFCDDVIDACLNIARQAIIHSIDTIVTTLQDLPSVHNNYNMNSVCISSSSDKSSMIMNGQDQRQKYTTSTSFYSPTPTPTHNNYAPTINANNNINNNNNNNNGEEDTILTIPITPRSPRSPRVGIATTSIIAATNASGAAGAMGDYNSNRNVTSIYGYIIHQLLGIIGVRSNNNNNAAVEGNENESSSGGGYDAGSSSPSNNNNNNSSNSSRAFSYRQRQFSFYSSESMKEDDMTLNTALSTLRKLTKQFIFQNSNSNYNNSNTSNNSNVRNNTKSIPNSTATATATARRRNQDKYIYRYPLNTVRPDFRRPTVHEQYWLWNALVVLGTLYSTKTIIEMIRTGALQKIILSSYITLSKTITERIIEPVSNLCRELLQTISRRQDGMVTRADLESSQQALNRMLEDFLKQLKQSPHEKAQVMQRLERVRSGGGSGSGSSTYGIVHGNNNSGSGSIGNSSSTGLNASGGINSQGTATISISTDTSSGSIDGSTGSSSSGGGGMSAVFSAALSSLYSAAIDAKNTASKSVSDYMSYNNISSRSNQNEEEIAARQLQEQVQRAQQQYQQEKASADAIMELLMQNYEEEMKKPITGLVFGNLMTTMLIQMQKLKVHTESALLTMDQVLASNQLTMAGTAAMPALLFVGLLGYGFQKFILSSSTHYSKPGRKTHAVRLAMSDVERSLSDAYANVGSSNEMGSNCVYCNPAAQRLASVTSADSNNVGGVYSSQQFSPFVHQQQQHSFSPQATRHSSSSSSSTSSSTATTPIRTPANTNITGFSAFDTTSDGDGGDIDVGIHSTTTTTTDTNNNNIGNHKLTAIDENNSHSNNNTLPPLVPLSPQTPIMHTLRPSLRLNSDIGIHYDTNTNSIYNSSNTIASRHHHQQKQHVRNMCDKQKRGILHFHLCQLRVEIQKLFFGRYINRHSHYYYQFYSLFSMSTVLALPRTVIYVLRAWFPRTFSIPYHTTWHSHISGGDNSYDNNNNNNKNSDGMNDDNSFAHTPTHTNLLKSSSKGSSGGILRSIVSSNNSNNHYYNHDVAAAAVDSTAVSSSGASEYNSLCQDIRILLSPDFQQCGCRKKETARRMRISYQCLIPPVQ